MNEVGPGWRSPETDGHVAVLLDPPEAGWKLQVTEKLGQAALTDIVEEAVGVKYFMAEKFKQLLNNTVTILAGGGLL